MNGLLLLHAEDNAKNQGTGHGLGIVPGKVASSILTDLIGRIEHFEERHQPPGPALTLQIDSVNTGAAEQQIADIQPITLRFSQWSCSDGTHSISSSSSPEVTATTAGLFMVR